MVATLTQRLDALIIDFGASESGFSSLGAAKYLNFMVASFGAAEYLAAQVKFEGDVVVGISEMLKDKIEGVVGVGISSSGAGQYLDKEVESAMVLHSIMAKSSSSTTSPTGDDGLTSSSEAWSVHDTPLNSVAVSSQSGQAAPAGSPKWCPMKLDNVLFDLDELQVAES